MRNRTRISSLDAFGLRDQRSRIYPALEASDGSTLSLDFTAMSNLDSRFTFTRSSTATFINSSGLVKYADHNLAVNSTWTDSNTPPTSWNIYNNTTPNAVISIPQSGQRQIVVTSGVQSFLWQSQTIPAGLAHTLSIVVHSITGTGPTAANLLAMNGSVAPPGSASILYYKDGVLSSGTTVVTPGVWSMVFSGGTQIRLVQSSNAATSTYTIVISSPQLQVGAVPLPASVSNSSTSAAYNAPRFDYDPTTLAPRGLLIEGSATNELQRSNEFNTSPWFTLNFNTPSIASPSVTDPAGGTSTWYCVPSGAGSVLHGFRYNTAFTAVAYTFSIWAKAAQHDKFIISDASSGQGACRFDLTAKTATVIAGTVTPTSPQIVEYPNGWFRCSFTMVMTAATRGMTYTSYPTGATISAFGATFTATGTDGMYFYGAQTEIGSGASSYIPTGSSTVQRASEACSMTGSNFSSWYGAPSAFTVLLEGITVSAGSYNRILNISSGANTTGSVPNANIGVANASSNRPFLNVFATANNDVDAYVPLAGAVTNGVSFKVAARCQAGLYRITRGVGLSTSSAHNGFPAGLANLYFGGSSGSYQLSTHYSKLKFWPVGLGDSQMDVLAT